MRLFSSMKEFDKATMSLHELAEIDIPYNDFIEQFSRHIADMSAYSLRRESSQSNRYNRRASLSQEEIEDKIESAVKSIKPDASLLKWRAAMITRTTSITDISGSAIVLDKIKEAGVSTVSEAYNILEELTGGSRHIFLPFDVVAELTFDDSECSDIQKSAYIHSIKVGSNSDTDTARVITMLINSKDNNELWKMATDLLISTPYQHFHLLDDASDAYLSYLEKALDKVCEAEDKPDLPQRQRCKVQLLINAKGSYYNRKKAPAGTAIGDACIESNFQDNHWYFSAQEKTSTSPEDYASNILKHASSDDVNADEYIHAALTALIHFNKHNEAATLAKAFLACDALLSDTECNKHTQDIANTLLDSKVVALSPLRRKIQFILDCANPNKVDWDILTRIENAIDSNELEGIEFFIEKLIPSLQDAIVARSSDLNVITEKLQPILGMPDIADNERLMLNLWLLACFSRNELWISHLTDKVDPRYLPLLEVTQDATLRETYKNLEEDEIKFKFNESVRIIENIINPSDHWAQHESVYGHIPRLLAFLHLANQVTLEKRVIYNSKAPNGHYSRRRSVFKANSKEQENINILEKSSGSEAKVKRLEAYYSLKRTKAYDDLTPHFDGNYCYLHSEKQSEILASTSVGLERVIHIMAHHNAEKLSFIIDSGAKLLLQSIYIPTIFHQLVCENSQHTDRFVFLLLNGGEKVRKPSTITDALQYCLPRNNIGFAYKGIPFIFDGDGEIGVAYEKPSDW